MTEQKIGTGRVCLPEYHLDTLNYFLSGLRYSYYRMLVAPLIPCSLVWGQGGNTNGLNIL